MIRLSANGEPEIYETTRRFGTILENVAIDSDHRRLDLDDASLTENTRAAYPISHIPNMTRKGTGGHPRNIIMLTCDAFGVLPPISRLTTEQAMYHFLSGYTAKVAGTERGVTEPRRPSAPVSARLSWRCRPAPTRRCSAKRSPSMRSSLADQHRLDRWPLRPGPAYETFVYPGDDQCDPFRPPRRCGDRNDPNFRLAVPLACPGVPSEILDPRRTWPDAAAYDRKAAELAGMFVRNFQENAADAPSEIAAAGPKV